MVAGDRRVNGVRRNSDKAHWRVLAWLGMGAVVVWGFFQLQNIAELHNRETQARIYAQCTISNERAEQIKAFIEVDLPELGAQITPAVRQRVEQRFKDNACPPKPKFFKEP